MALLRPLGDVFVEELQCNICLDRLQSPRILTCLHSFCEHCLQVCVGQTLDGFLQCPTCRERTVIPTVGITGLKPDFRAKKLLEALDKDRTSKCAAPALLDCSRCKSFVACLICKECDFKICQGCSEFSNPNWPTCQNHPGLPLMNPSDGESQKLETSGVLLKCPRHFEMLKFYCKSCKICICADCTVLDHSKVDGHECVYLKEIMPQLRRDVDKLAAQVSINARDLDSFSEKIGAMKEELDRKSSAIDQEIGTEVAKIKAILLEQNHNFIEKTRKHVHGIEQRNAAAKEAVQSVARRLHQAASSKDDIEVAGMHQRLQESVRKITDSDSDASTLDSLQTTLDTFKLKRTRDDSALHFSLNLVQQERVLEQQAVPNARRLCAAGKKANGTLSVIYETQTGHMSCNDLQKKTKLAMPDLSHSSSTSRGFSFGTPSPFLNSVGGGNTTTDSGFGGFSFGTAGSTTHGSPFGGFKFGTAGSTTHGSPFGGFKFGTAGSTTPGSAFGTAGNMTTSGKGVSFGVNSSAGYSNRGPYGILPNGQVCFIKGDKLYRGSKSVTLHGLSLNRVSKSSDNNSRMTCMAVNERGYIYVAAAGLEYLLEVAPTNAVSGSKPIGNIFPFAITTSPHEAILIIAHKPASVSLVDGQQKIRCIFSAREGIVWENAAVACGHDERVYLLSSQRSKLTLEILDKAGNLQETVFSDRPVSSIASKPSPSPSIFGTYPATAGLFGRSAGANSPSSPEELGPRLSIAVAQNGDIAAVLGENELVLITLEERDVRKT